MLKLFIDTCVWIDVGKDHQQHVLLTTLDQLIRDGRIALLLPTVARDEFTRHKGKILDVNRKSLQTVLKRAKDLIDQHGEHEEKAGALQQLHAIDQRLPRLGDLTGIVTLIERLLSGATVIEVSNEAKLRAAERALQKKAPFHNGNNSMADAVLIESFAEVTRGPASTGHRFGFVTHNKDDFKQPGGDDRVPHADFAGIFTPRKVRYFATLMDALQSLGPDVIPDADVDEYPWQPRTTDGILEAMDELIDRVWYDRHQVYKQKVDAGIEHVSPDIWAGAKRNAKKLEQKYGAGNLGPYSKFDWGMLNGKLSALRWVLGEDWDELYT